MVRQKRQIPATDPEFLSDRLRAVLTWPRVEDLVARYLKGPPSTPFAGVFFDQLGRNPKDEIVVDDVVAASLLDVRFSPRAIHQIIQEARGNAELAGVSADVPLWSASDRDLTHLRATYSRLQGCDGVARTKASKLLARKRPQMAPITDSVVERVLKTSGWAHLETLRHVLSADHDLVKRMEQLSCGAVSPLRALDVAIWMIGSDSRAAKSARRECASPDWPA